MDEKEIIETDIWTLYNKSVMYARKNNYFTDVDRCNNFYNGDQWEGLLIEGIEPVQLNFIQPIVNYKVNRITKNLRAINYSADNVEGTEFRATAKKVCDLFNQRAARVWERDQLDHKIKKLIRQSAINGESVLYITYNEEQKDPENEVLNKLDIYYENENEPDIQRQAYILAKQRMSVYEAKKLAREYEVEENKLDYIIGDEDTLEEAGESAKDEVSNMVTVVTKFYKKDDTIHFSKGTRYCTICEDKDMGITLYPFAHMLWSEKEGSARGEGEIRTLIPNQIEVNKTIMRRLLTAKNTAYPQKVYNKDKVSNPEAINTVGGVIEAEGMDVDDVRKIFSTTSPAQMSPDVRELQQELISTTRELANASDTATGQVNPEAASGRAILAVQQASEQPLDDQNVALNTMLEDVARIWMDMWRVNNSDGLQMENLQTNPMTGEDEVVVENIPSSVLEELKTTVKIDITPKGSYDKYAQEVSLENLAKTEQFMNTAWLEDYVSLLDNDAVMPKIKLEDLIKRRKAAQERIRQIQQQGSIMQQQVAQMMQTGEIMPKEMQQYMGNNQQPMEEGANVEY